MTTRTKQILIALGVFALQPLDSPTMRAQAPNAERSAPRSFLQQHCYRCHGAEKQEGKLRLDTLGSDFADSRTSATWIEVRDKLNLGEMPPADETQPDGDEVVNVAKWIANQLRTM